MGFFIAFMLTFVNDGFIVNLENIITNVNIGDGDYANSIDFSN